MTEAATHQVSRRNLWAILGLFATVMTIGGTDVTKVTVSLPAIVDDLGLGALTSLWVADIYALAAGVLIIPAAVLADRFGRKRLYMTGLSVALASAALAGATPDPSVLLLARLGQGAGAAILIAATVAIIRVTFPGLRLRALAYGVWTASFSLGSALGPLFGGGLVELADWRWVFWINVPILVVCFFAAQRVLRESTNPDPPALDLPSVLSSAGAVALLIIGLKGFAQPDAQYGLSGIAVLGGVAAAVVFVHRQGQLPRPFLDVTLFRNRLLATSAAAIAATNGSFNAVLYLLTQQFQIIDGYSAVHAGVLLIPLAAASAVGGGLVGPFLQRHFTPQHVIVTGLAVGAVGFLILAADVHLALVLLGLGSGIIMTIAANAIMSAAPQQRTADAGAIQESAFAIGAGAGIAVLGALAIVFGGQPTGDGTLASIYGAGADAAIGIGAVLYTLFALTASLVLLSTSRGDLND